MRNVNPFANKHREGDRARTPAIAATLLIISSTLSTPGHAASYAGGTRHEQSREPLGSLRSDGEVYLNDSPVAAESSIVPGDRVRTGTTGTATLAVNGKGTLRILPRSQVAFSGSDQFNAELEGGTVVSNSTAWADGVILRIGNYVVSSVREPPATFRITRAQDGSFLVSCLVGSVGVLALESKVGRFLQGGQSLTVSEKQAVLSPAPSASAKRKGNFATRWLIVGLAGAGAAAAVAAKMSHGGSGSSGPTVTLP